VKYKEKKKKKMKISAMIIVALAAVVAVIPASATSDEAFGQKEVSKVEVSSSLRALAKIKKCKVYSKKCVNHRKQICTESGWEWWKPPAGETAAC
jgi:hypothetical protein